MSTKEKELEEILRNTEQDPEFTKIKELLDNAREKALTKWRPSIELLKDFGLTDAFFKKYIAIDEEGVFEYEFAPDNDIPELASIKSKSKGVGKYSRVLDEIGGGAPRNVVKFTIDISAIKKRKSKKFPNRVELFEVLDVSYFVAGYIQYECLDLDEHPVNRNPEKWDIKDLRVVAFFMNHLIHFALTQEMKNEIHCKIPPLALKARTFVNYFEKGEFSPTSIYNFYNREKEEEVITMNDVRKSFKLTTLTPEKVARAFFSASLSDVGSPEEDEFNKEVSKLLDMIEL